MTRLRWLIAAVVVLDAALLLLPPGRSILDARFYYNADTALAYVTALGESGRHAYALHECIDLVFIAAYTALLRELTARWNAKPRVAAYLPAAFDLIETVGILVLLASPSRGLAGIVGFATAAKWLGLATSLVALVIARRAFAR